MVLPGQSPKKQMGTSLDNVERGSMALGPSMFPMQRDLVSDFGSTLALEVQFMERPSDGNRVACCPVIHNGV